MYIYLVTGCSGWIRNDVCRDGWSLDEELYYRAVLSPSMLESLFRRWDSFVVQKGFNAISSHRDFELARSLAKCSLFSLRVSHVYV